MSTKFSATLMAILLLLTPLAFWTLTPNYFATLKQLIILVVALLFLLHYFTSLIKEKSFYVPNSHLTAPLILFVIVIIINLFASQEGRPEALAGKGALLLALPLIALAILCTKDRAKLGQLAVKVIIGSGAILAIHTLLQLTWLPTLSFIPPYMQSKTFTPTGSFLTTLIMMLISAATAVAGLKRATDSKKPLYLIAVMVTIISSVAVIALMLPGGALALDLIPYQETWSISLDALKSLKSMLFGVGLSNYSLLYTTVKPLSLNLGPLWNALPQTGSSELLTILATAGLTGAVSLVSLMIAGYRHARSLPALSPLAVAFLLTTLALILTPGTIALYALFFVLLPLLDQDSPRERNLSASAALGLGLAGILITLVTFGYALRPHIAEYYMREGQLALSRNDGKAVYENERRAIAWYPGQTSYHIAYADLNMSLASALSQKPDLTETDRQTISALVGQSIREAKSAVQLHANYSISWQTLAKIYRNLINVADGADKFALDYYGRAVSLDPANPLLRVEYGGLFYQLGVSAKDETVKQTYLARARSEFQTALQLRPSYANAYYNLAKLLETEKDYQNAYLAMQKVVANLDPLSPEYATALAELETLKTKLLQPTPTPQPKNQAGSADQRIDSLATPSPLPSPLPGGPIELPAEPVTP